MTNNFYRTALKASTALFAVAAFAAPTSAQVSGQNPVSDDETISSEVSLQQGDVASQPIVITGSRIASPVIDSAAPVQIIGEENIQTSGVTNIQDLLLENPVFGTPTYGRTNSAFLTSGTGVASIDLRNLGAARTLVLINGRRVVSGVPGTTTVDTNVIPTQFIERVDVLTGGASSLYGSDAIAGVVNFVYKTDFEGLAGDVQAGITEHGDSERYQANLTMGTNLADGRGNVMAHIGYSKETGLPSRYRKNTRVDDYTLMGFTGDPADYATSEAPFLSSFPTQGRFIVGDSEFTYDQDGTLRPCFQTNGGICDAPGTPFDGQEVGPDGFNRQQFRTLAVPVERYLMAVRGNYEIADSVNAFIEGTFNRTTASREIEPFALESGGTNGVFPGTGGYPIENFVGQDLDGDGVISPGEGGVVVSPIVPGAIVDAATDTDGDGLRDIGFARRLSEFGTRNSSTTRNFYRFVAGLEGTVFDDRFSWDVSYNYGRTDESQISNGQVNIPNFRDALAVAPDFGDVDADGDVTEAICLNPDARAAGCVPINIFGNGAISQAAIDYIAAESNFDTEITQQVVTANLAGDLIQLPAGPLQIAVGSEYRKETSFENWDALTNSGLNGGNALPDSEGKFDVIEGYGEIRVPVLADTPFFQALDLGAAVRVSDYSTVGTVLSYNGTVTWRPIDDLRLRGTYARSVRAPNIGELFSGLSQTFPSGLTDPCEGVGATGGGTLGDVCRSYPGVAANIAENGEFTLTQPDIQGISGFNGGNPDLEEEKSDSWTVGAVLTPTSIDPLRNLTLTVDYYNIKIDNVIASFGRQFTLQQCFNGGNQQFCDLITRRPEATSTNSAGSIEFVNAIPTNAAKLETSGIDVTADYFVNADALGAGGRVFANVRYTHLLEYDYFSTVDAPADPSDGEIGSTKDRFTANLGVMNDDARLSFTGTFIGRSDEDDQFCAGFGLEAGCVSVPAEFYLDTQASFRASDEFEVYFGVDNLLDNDAPNILSGTTYNVTGADTAADVYDIFGRRYYVGTRFTF